MLGRRTLLTFALAIAGAWSACAIYDKSLLLSGTSTDGDGGAEDGSTATDAGLDGAGIDAGCRLFGAPAPPSTDDGTKAVDITFAMAAFRLVPNGTASVNHPHAPVAVDIDQRCTCPGPPSCISPSAKPNCDADGGGDDTAGDLWATFASLAPGQFNDDSLNQGLRLGYNGLLFRLREYNGGKNDSQVTVIGYESGGTPGADTKMAVLPKYDGTDVWTVDPASLVGGTSVDSGAGCEGNDTICLPIIFDTKAYVTNGVLVARVSIPVTAGGANTKLRVALSDAVMIAPLVFDGKSYRVDEGFYAGRWEQSAFLTSLQSVNDPLDPSQPLCGSSATYQNIKSMACGRRDVMSQAVKDNTSAQCDSLSVTVSFSAVQAHLGQIVQPPPLAQKCGAGYSDTCP